MTSRTATENTDARIVSKSLNDVFRIRERRGRLYVDTPFTFSDGDHFTITIVRSPEGWMISDLGATMGNMINHQLDVESLLEEPFTSELDGLLAQSKAAEEQGELQMTASTQDLASRVLDFCLLIRQVVALGAP